MLFINTEKILKTHNVFFACCTKTQEKCPLEKSEIELINKACRKRKTEFILGRNCAKEALKKAGYNEKIQIVNHETGYPIPPEDFLLSISHTKDIGVSITGKSKHYNAIGIDVENENKKISNEAFKLITNDNEKILTGNLNDVGIIKELLKLIIFSGKESAYKAYSSYYGKTFTITEIEITGIKLNNENTVDDFIAGSFDFKLISKKIKNPPQKNFINQGGFFVENNYLITTAYL